MNLEVAVQGTLEHLANSTLPPQKDGEFRGGIRELIETLRNQISEYHTQATEVVNALMPSEVDKQIQIEEQREHLENIYNAQPSTDTSILLYKGIRIKNKNTPTDMLSLMFHPRNAEDPAMMRLYLNLPNPQNEMNIMAQLLTRFKTLGWLNAKQIKAMSITNPDAPETSYKAVYNKHTQSFSIQSA